MTTLAAATSRAEGSSAAATPRGLWRRLGSRGVLTWLAYFFVPFVSLLWHNGYLFSKKLFPIWDYAADTILSVKARNLDLLVGNHSRLGFYHPGPAESYLRAGGEELFYRTLHIVPAPWNAQVLTIFLVNCALLATAVWIVADRVRSWPATVGLLAIALSFLALHPYILDSPWMPNIYVTKFLLLLVAAASVATGRVGHLWALVLAGGLLIHGHVCFLLFVPPIAGLAVALPLLKARGRIRAWLRGHWRDLAVPGLLCSLFLLPILLNLALHWPGEFGKYLTYGSNQQGHSLGKAVSYALWYWHGGGGRAYFAIGGMLLAVMLARRQPDPELRRFLSALLAVDALATLLVVYYATSGVDDLGATYIAEFSYMVPLTVLFVIAVSALGFLQPDPRERIALSAVGALVALFALHAGGSGNVLEFNDSAQSDIVQRLDAETGGKPIQVWFGPGSDWQPTIGLIDAAAWQGKRLCFIGGHWTVMVTDTYVCGPADAGDGTVIEIMGAKDYEAQRMTAPILAHMGSQVLLRRP